VSLRRGTLAAVSTLGALLIALLGVLTNVGTSLLPTSWAWTADRPVVWGAVVTVVVLIVILTIIQIYLTHDGGTGNSSRSPSPEGEGSPDRANPVPGEVGGGGGVPTIVHNNAEGTVVIHSTPTVSPSHAQQTAAAVGGSGLATLSVSPLPELPDQPWTGPVTVGWGHVAMPTGTGLTPLQPEVWDSPQVRQAVAYSNPGAVVAFARHAHGLHPSRLADMAGLSQAAICHLESGGELAHDVRALRSLQRLLGIPPYLLGLSDESVPLRAGDARQLFAHLGDGELALQGRTPDGRLVPVAVDRRTLLSLSLSAALGASAVDATGLLDDNRPIDPDMLRRLRVVRRLLNESDNWLGPGSLLPIVHKMYELTDRARRAARGDLRQQLIYVASLYAEFYGWMRQESGDLPGAVAWTERALQQAHAVDDPNLAAYAYVRLGQLAEIERDDDRVIGLARAAQRCGGLSRQVQALALQQEARGHAIAGAETDCLTRFDQARELIAGVRPQWSDEYQVGFFFEEARLNAQRAACLLELGKPRDAIDAYRDIIANGELVCRWERGMHLAKLARAYAVIGEPSQAAATAFQALSLGRDTGTKVITDELRKLRVWSHLAALSDALDSMEQASTTRHQSQG
jgi:tetratricopeptide (TPR) repeat protein